MDLSDRSRNCIVRVRNALMFVYVCVYVCTLPTGVAT